MTLGVVVSCYRQERFLARTVAALEAALEGQDWHGVLEFATGSAPPLPPPSPRWRVIASYDPASGHTTRPLTPGAGRMVGFAACGGDWVLFADSDVEVDAAWMRAAIATAAHAPGVAGIGGRIEEWFVEGERTWLNRSDLLKAGAAEHAVDHLAALAFYRRAALEGAGGYDVRLDSDEDFELGLRLRARGLELRSLGMLGARHWSAPRPSFSELSRRWQTGICFGTGQVLRLYAGRPGFGELLRRQRLYFAALGLWALGALALMVSLATGNPGPFSLWVLVVLAVAAFMAARKKSLTLGVHSLLTWTLQGAGLIVGLFRLPRAATPGGPREAAC